MKTKLQKVKLFIKLSLIFSVLIAFVVFGFFIRPIHSFENHNMKKWVSLSETERVYTVRKIIKDSDNDALLLECVTKIAELENSNEMIIRDAISLCYNGIKLNIQQPDEK